MYQLPRMTRMGRYLWVVGLVLALAVVPAQADDTRPLFLETDASVERLDAGHDALLDFRLPAATRAFRALAERPDGDIAAYHYLSLTALLKGLMADEPAHFDTFIARSDTLRQLLDDQPRSRWKRHLEAEQHLKRAIARGKQERYIRAAWSARSAFRAFESLVADEPDFAEPYLGMGLLHVAVASLPSTYQSVLRVLGFSGQIDEGMEELATAVEESRYNREFAAVSRALVEILFNMRGPDGTEMLGRLHDERPNSMLHALLYGYALYENYRAEEAYRVVQRAVEWPEEEYFYIDYLDFYMGETLFARRDYQKAATWYERYIDRHAGPALKDLAYYRLGLAREMQGHRSEALRAYRQVDGRRDFDADQYAERWAAQRINQTLDDRDRRLVEGEGALYWGAYDQAEVTLRGVFDDSQATEAQRTHAAFLIGRAHHVQGNGAQAFPAYRFAIDHPADRRAMWAPWAQLYIGHLHEQRGRIDAARTAYDRAADYRTPFDYYQSLEQYVRFARERLPQRE